MQINPLRLLSVLGTAMLIGCSTPATKLPPARGTLSRRDAADIVADIRQSSSDRILWIEESHGEVRAFTGDKNGGILHVYRRKSGRFQYCGGGYWDAAPQEGEAAAPFDPNWHYNPGIRYDVDR
jgi:hypothetical protein